MDSVRTYFLQTSNLEALMFVEYLNIIMFDLSMLYVLISCRFEMWLNITEFRCNYVMLPKYMFLSSYAHANVGPHPKRYFGRSDLDS